MRRAHYVFLLIPLLWAPIAQAQNVLFTSPSDIVIDLGDNPLITVDVELNLQMLSDFRKIDAILGSFDSVGLSFAFDAAWEANFDTPSLAVPDDAGGVYADGLLIASENATLVGFTSAPIGTLTIDTSLQPMGNYIIFVDFDIDDTSEARKGLPENDEFENLYGSFEYTVNVPEPASLVMLALGSLLVTRRNKAGRA